MYKRQDFGVGDLNAVGPANDITTITVSQTNIDDIVRGVKRKINAGNGVELMNENGLAFAWGATHFEILESYVHAQGFTEADIALKNGIASGLYYSRATHYLTNDNAANHVFAGVRKLATIAILRPLWGQVVMVEDPAGSTNNLLSGIGIASRATYGQQWPAVHLALWHDINTAN